MVVKSELDKLGLHYTKVGLGEVNIKETIDARQRTLLKTALLLSGLEVMEDKKAILIERIKSVVIEIVQADDESNKMNFSGFLSKKLNYDYNYLASLFSEVTGITIERYLIAHKIERVKELLLYHEYTLTEISYRLNYSSVSHLSGQFKKVTGLTPTYYRKLRHKKPAVPGEV